MPGGGHDSAGFTTGGLTMDSVYSHVQPRQFRGITRVNIVLGIVFLALVGVGRPALAHAVSDSGWTYTSPSNCTFNMSEVSDGAGGGQFYTEVWSDFGTPVGCAMGNVRQAGQLRLGYDLLRWDPSWGWTVCNFNGWYHNAAPSLSLTLDSGAYAFAPCGSGWYGVSGLGYVNVNGTWRGGSMWSWDHYLN